MSPGIPLVALLLVSSARAESFKAWAARGAREEREKDAKTAFQSYSNALSAWKDSDGRAGKAKVLCARAALRDRGGDEAGALEDYSGCVVLDRKNAKALDRLGELRLKSGKVSSAIGDFYRAIAIDIRFAAAYADRARAYELQGDREFAAEDYRRACGLGAKAACSKATELAPPAKAAAHRAARAAPDPRFSDCLGSIQACVDEGGAFGGCVVRAPACERAAVKGCCPRACLKAYRKALDGGASEAAAYRDVFAAGAACAASPLIDKR